MNAYYQIGQYRFQIILKQFSVQIMIQKSMKLSKVQVTIKLLIIMFFILPALQIGLRNPKYQQKQRHYSFDSILNFLSGGKLCESNCKQAGGVTTCGNINTDCCKQGCSGFVYCNDIIPNIKGCAVTDQQTKQQLQTNQSLRSSSQQLGDQKQKQQSPIQLQNQQSQKDSPSFIDNQELNQIQRQKENTYGGIGQINQQQKDNQISKQVGKYAPQIQGQTQQLGDTKIQNSSKMAQQSNNTTLVNSFPVIRPAQSKISRQSTQIQNKTLQSSLQNQQIAISQTKAYPQSQIKKMINKQAVYSLTQAQAPLEFIKQATISEKILKPQQKQPQKAQERQPKQLVIRIPLITVFPQDSLQQKKHLSLTKTTLSQQQQQKALFS